MLKQFITALSGTLTPALLYMLLSLALPSRKAQSGKVTGKVSRICRLFGLILGLAVALIFALLRSMAVVSQQTPILRPALWVNIISLTLTVLGLIFTFLSGMGKKDTKKNGTIDQTGKAVELDKGEKAENRGNIEKAREQRLVSRETNPGLVLFTNLAGAIAIASTIVCFIPDVIIQLANFVETGESAFTSAMLTRAVGFLLGVGAAMTVAAIFRTLKTSISPVLLMITSLLFLLLVLVQQVTALTQILVNTAVLELTDAEFSLLVSLINHNNSLIIAQTAVFLLPAAAALIAGMKMGPEVSAASSGARQRSLRKFRRHAYAATVWSLLAVLFVSLSLTSGVALTTQEVTLSAPEKYQLTKTTATIPYSQLADGHLHRFQYKAKDGTVMRFIIIKKSGGSYGVGLDACENCGDAGYYEKDGKIVCKKCDVAINLATIGFKGGCNPIPLPYQSSGGKITIKTADLDALSSHFAIS